MYNTVGSYIGVALPGRTHRTSTIELARPVFVHGSMKNITAGQRQAYTTLYRPECTLETIQIIGWNMASPQQLIEALAAAQQVTSGKHDRAKSVLAIDIIGCQFVDEDTIRGLGRLFPRLSYVTIFDCLNFDFAWALEC
ncbi:hypothetical protein LTR56_004562 [Elasticomyces elasticus]|nr:hypothetical protein LTR56_004562 [Elasticomyces elasticus]KAK3659918.1 hypothetical protein LTR22_008285 [Elasticomyces elasticus]KAK4925901.1 hypothetical protein LTR49_007039 [Elasticomyces elasticus]KAK5768138.1 hypothetical protein LTS12_001622 [Elasticomyces elasticus]